MAETSLPSGMMETSGPENTDSPKQEEPTEIHTRSFYDQNG